MEPVFGNEPIETSSGVQINKIDNYWIDIAARGHGYYVVNFPEPISVLKSGKGKPQRSMRFNFRTGQSTREYPDRYISIRNVTDPADFEFDV